MVVASVPLGLSLAAIWWTPTGSVLIKTIYYAIISIIVMTAYTSINLPFAALSTEISEKTAIRTRLMFSYGLGDAGTGLVATQFGFFLFKFFISAGLPVIIAGSLLMLIKIWDAVNDPLIGWLSDRTKSRWGPRIPWMVAASVPLGFSLAAIWWTPTGSVPVSYTHLTLPTSDLV